MLIQSGIPANIHGDSILSNTLINRLINGWNKGGRRCMCGPVKKSMPKYGQPWLGPSHMSIFGIPRGFRPLAIGWADWQNRTRLGSFCTSKKFISRNEKIYYQQACAVYSVTNRNFFDLVFYYASCSGRSNFPLY